MSRNQRARRLAAYVAYGGGALAIAGVAFAGVLVSQAILANRAIPRGVLTPLDSNGLYGQEFAGTPVVLAMLGDSTSVGVGVDSPDETPGALLARPLSEILQRPVRLVCVGQLSAQSAHLHLQAQIAQAYKPNVVVIMIGANDVIRRASVNSAVNHLARVVRSFHEQGTAVVVGTCPDVSTVEPIRPPLRWLTQRLCRDFATAQTIAVVAEGGRTVSLGDLLGETFAQRPAEMFSADRFHPSAQGYALAAEMLLPSVVAALGVEAPAPAPESAETTSPIPESVEAESLPRQGKRKLALAAADAASTAGTEVAPTSPAAPGKDSGLWAELRNRLARVAEWAGQ